MLRRIVSGIMLMLLLICLLTSAFNIDLVAGEPRIIAAHDDDLTMQPVKDTLNQLEPESTYVGVAGYYDDRKSVVTSTLDDFWGNESHPEWAWVRGNFSQRHIYYSIGACVGGVKGNEWDDFQQHLDTGFAEAACHSWNHTHIPYDNYTLQIVQSKEYLIDNLDFPCFQEYGSNEYVYAWIEPYGQYDNIQRETCGEAHYLCDRDITTDYGFATWDVTNDLYNRIGTCSGLHGMETLSLDTLNSRFDSCYNNGEIYHAYGHPNNWNSSDFEKINSHLDHIKNKTDVWYVPFGVLYLYHWVDDRNIANVTSSGSGQNKIFKIGINETDHLNYGVSYPITYVFNIPSNWTSGYVYYRYLDTDPWTLMNNKSSEDLFNGIDASRFDFTNHKAYVSVGFSNISHNIYLQLRHSERVEAPVVGGFVVRVYKPGLLAPYIAFAIAIVAIRIGAVYAKKRWTRRFAVQKREHCKERKS